VRGLGKLCSIKRACVVHSNKFWHTAATRFHFPLSQKYSCSSLERGVTISPTDMLTFFILGQFGSLLVGIRRYDPSVTCLGSYSSVRYMSQDLLDKIPITSVPQVFGPGGKPRADVVVPTVITSDSRTPCKSQPIHHPLTLTMHLARCVKNHLANALQHHIIGKRKSIPLMVRRSWDVGGIYVLVL
jgi:hypothetical protein